ncbi:MAG: aminoacyl-tRNA hydrolase, partial [Thermodesulfovibrionia bacterium]|nr:aminoacyl-tRNA hydrolase [Thermodesulfovibrionia bacterium]
MVVDAISSRFSIPLKGKSKNFVYGRGLINEQIIFLIKPLTFMNRSGTAVKDALRTFKKTDAVIVIHDDLDLDTGVIKIKKNGSSGGHKGIESIIEATGTKDFVRLKIGIGRPDKISAEDYVLSTFDKHERPVIKKVLESAVNALVMIIEKGISHAQNVFH